MLVIMVGGCVAGFAIRFERGKQVQGRVASWIPLLPAGPR